MMTEVMQKGCPVPDDPCAGACEGARAESLELDPWAAAPEAGSVQCKKTSVEIDPCRQPDLPRNVKLLVQGIASYQVARKRACQPKLLCNLWLTTGPCHLFNKATAWGLLTILETRSGQAQSSSGPESSHLVGLHHGWLTRSSFVFPACARCLELVRGPSVR